eukprot:523572_1
MVMEYLFDPVAVGSCGGLWFMSSHIWMFNGGHGGDYKGNSGGSYGARYGRYCGYGADRGYAGYTADSYGGGSGDGHSYGGHGGYCGYSIVGRTFCKLGGRIYDKRGDEG